MSIRSSTRRAIALAPTLGRVLDTRLEEPSMIISSPNHWWQNWPKTHAYVAERMFFPKSAGEVADAIRTAEADQRPLRAVGGGWSFSDAALPGTIFTNRPSVYAVDALSGVVPRAETFPLDRSEVSVATIQGNAPTADLPGSMVMLHDHPVNAPATVRPDWTYLGHGQWIWTDGNVYPLNNDLLGFVDYLARNNLRPIRFFDPQGTLSREEADVAGSLVMVDLARKNASPSRTWFESNNVHASRDWFYCGAGVWIVGVSGDSPSSQGTLQDLSSSNRLMAPDMLLSPRAAQPGQSLSLLLSREPTVPAEPEPAYLLNTRSLVSSLQQNLPHILSRRAADATSEQPPNGAARRFFFHVEAGITIAELGPLLAHQSPRLTLQAISGSPGATLAGALSTATHGAEFNWPLLVDRVKAVHLIGPGGLQWWIEGDEPIVNRNKLHAAYPDIPRKRIISGTTPVGGILPQDWLNAAIVSMGSMGVLYSAVLEAVPVFGVREVVLQTTWRQLGSGKRNRGPDLIGLGKKYQGQQLATLLRSADSKDVSTRLVKLMQNGNLNGTGIPQVDDQGNPVNQYADLAINPNKTLDGDYDCWIGNREVTAQVPLESRPSAGNETADIIKGIGMEFDSKELRNKFGNIYGFNSIGDTGDFAALFKTVGNFFANKETTLGRVERMTGAADFMDVALDTLLTPMVGGPNGAEVAQRLLSGILAGLLNTANHAGRSDRTGVSVGALGFPGSGLMGTGIEIALSPADAFGFVQTEILDHVTEPFFGYVSIRLCSKTQTLMGMQQFGDKSNPCSVMIEVVGYGNEGSRNFVRLLQHRTVERIKTADLEAMLHWGLENGQLRGHHLRTLKALRAPTRSGMGRLDTFKAVRALVHAGAPKKTHRVFDNSFTDRLEL